MTYVVKLLKVGSVAEGDGSDDFGPTQVNPFTEFPVVPGFFLQDSQASVTDKLVGIQRIPGTQSLQFVDSSGTTKLADILNHTGLAQLSGNKADGTPSDVTTPAGGGTQAATVVSVGGVSATNIGSLYSTLTGSSAPALFYATPASGAGAPSLRSIAASDIPSIPGTQITGLAASAYTDATNASNISSGSLNIARIDASSGANGQILQIVGGVLQYANAASGAGTVTSVALQLPASIYSSSGSAITTSGTITPTLANQGANYIWSGPASGSAAAPTFRALVPADIPTLAVSKITGLAASATSDTTNASNIIAGTLSLARLDASTASVGQVLGYSGSTIGWVTPAAGTVTSVGLSLPGFLSVSPSAITNAGTFTVSLANQTAGAVFAGPSSGNAAAPGFRSLVATDIPTISYSQVSGLAASATTDTSSATNITAGALSLARLSTTGASSGYVLTYNGSAVAWAAPATSGGTVTSVSLTAPNIFAAVGGSPVTTSGTLALTLATQSPNYVWAGPASGSTAAAPSFRSLAAADIPTISYTQVSGLAASATTDTTNASNIATGALATARISTTGATSGYVLTYNGTSAVWAAAAAGGSVTYPLLAPAGSAAAPSYSFSANTGAGMYLDGTGNVNLANNGADVLRFNGTLMLMMDGIAAVQGSASQPGIRFVNNGNAGLYSTGSGNVSLSAGGTQVLGATNGGVALPVGVSGGLKLNGSTSGALTLASAATTSAYTLTYPSAQGAAGQTLLNDGSGNLSWGTASGGSGTVTSVALSAPNIFAAVGGSPVTTSGTLALTLASQSANMVWAGPSSGSSAAPTFRTLVVGDIPSLPATQITGLAASATTDTTNAGNITTGALALARLSTSGAASGQVILYNGTSAAWGAAPSTFASVGLTGSSSGNVLSLSAAAATAAYTLTYPAALAQAASALVSDTSGNLAYLAYVSAATASTLVLRDSAGGAAFAALGAASVAVTKTYQSTYLASAPATVSGSGQFYAYTGGLPYFMDGSGNAYTLLTNSGLTTHVAPAGAAGTPGYTFLGSTSTGMYSPAANQVALAANGTQILLGTATSVTFPNATSMTLGASGCVATLGGSLAAPSVGVPYGFAADAYAGMGYATSYLRLFGPSTNGATVYIGNGTSYYGMGVGVPPSSTANTALALSGAVSMAENSAPTATSGYVQAYANSTDHHLYANSPVYGQVCLTGGGVPPAKSTTAASTTVALTDNGRTFMLDGTYAGTSTLNLPASSSTTDQVFRVMQSQASYGGVVTAASGTNIQFDTVPGSSGGSVSWNANGSGFCLFMPKGKTTWSLLYSTGAVPGTYTVS